MFVEEYLKELREERYTPAAWGRYLTRCWQLGRGEAAGNPSAVRSILVLGLVLFALAFAGSVALAVATDLTVARQTLVWTGLWLIVVIGTLLLHLDLLRDGDGYPLSSINLPTAITTFRMILIPALAITMLAGHWRIAFWLFLVGELSDVVDGWMARRWHQETRLGVLADPLTDIFFHLALFLSLAATGIVGVWVLMLATLRYGGLLVGGAIIHVTRGPVRIQSTLPGKLTGLALGVLVGYLLLGPSYGAGSLGAILTPLALDALLILLAGSVVHAAVMGWYNFRHAQAAAETSRKVIRDVRFRSGGR